MSTLQIRRWAWPAVLAVSMNWPALSPAATLNVPADYPTIQACIDAAVSGVDECVVAPGAYCENISFLGKAITVRSAGGPTTASIGCFEGTAVTCAAGEGPATVLDGFTIYGGTGMKRKSGITYGGGMYNHLSSPTVTNCIFIRNVADIGGGIYNLYAAPTLRNCVFDDNHAGFGGGMANVYSTPLLRDCTFTRNSASGLYPELLGGGMYNYNSSPTVIHSRFSRNTAEAGGGMYNDHLSSPVVTFCTFTRNAANSYFLDPAGGGGMFNYGGSPTVTSCVFVENAAAPWGGGMVNFFSSPRVDACKFIGNAGGDAGGGMANYIGTPVVMNSTFCGNTADALHGYGGGVWNGGGNPLIAGCTFSGNVATAGGGMFSTYYSDEPGSAVRNCVFWGDSPDEIATEVIDSSDEIGHEAIAFSALHGGLPVGAVDGGGNLDLNPEFVRPPDPGPDGMWDGVDDDYGDLRLQAGSPCINAGDPGFVAQPQETDLDGHARVLCGRVDMGAYEFGIGDYDCNQTVNLTDFAAWESCMTGPTPSPIPQPPNPCAAFDFNADSTVDLLDFAAFQRVFTAP